MSVQKLTTREEFETALKDTGLVVLDFYATWCGPCRRVSPHLDTLASENTNVRFYKVDVDEFNALASDFNIRAMPTLLFFKDGRKIHEVIGADLEKISRTVSLHQN